MEENRIIHLLSRKTANEASPEELKELEELLQKYPDAIYYEEVLKDLWLPSAQTEDNSEYLNEQYAKHKLKYADRLTFDFIPETTPDIPEQPVKRHYPAVWLLGITACICCLFFFIHTFQLSSQPNFTTVITGKGVRKQFQLPDGTKVWLNSESSFSYDEDMLKHSQRSVQLVGEAFFDVAHDKRHPFIVKTNKIAIRVLGTAFNVTAYPNEERSTATLIRGSIELTVNSHTSSKVILKPSEKFDLIDNKAGKGKNNNTPALEDVTLKLDNIVPYKVGSAEYIAETSWKENRLIFQNERFEDLIPRLERWYNVKINVNNKAALNYKFTGIFTKETIDEALTAMRDIKQFNFKIENDGINIY